MESGTHGRRTLPSVCESPGNARCRRALVCRSRRKFELFADIFGIVHGVCIENPAGRHSKVRFRWIGNSADSLDRAGREIGYGKRNGNEGTSHRSRCNRSHILGFGESDSRDRSDHFDQQCRLGDDGLWAGALSLGLGSRIERGDYRAFHRQSHLGIVFWIGDVVQAAQSGADLFGIFRRFGYGGDREATVPRLCGYGGQWSGNCTGD